MQAQFKVTDPYKQAFCNNSVAEVSCSPPAGKAPRNYKAYINPTNGILPKQFVSITVPFYTQLKETTAATIGRMSGQYIDWWNAQRIFFYYGKTAKTAAFNYNVISGKPTPPVEVTPINGASVPSCAHGNSFNCETPKLVWYDAQFPTGSIPFDFGEYTFAAAEGPPPGGNAKSFKIDLGIVNFNVSNVDGTYLPVAMAALDNNTPGQRVYLGTTASVSAFHTTLSNFSNGGKRWPYYWPSYFSLAAPTTAQPTPQDGDAPYFLPKIPSQNVVFAESFKLIAPAPPVVSTNTQNGDGKNPNLGTVGDGVFALWNKCAVNNNDLTDTCKNIRTVKDFFTRNYQKTCGHESPPSETDMLIAVTGWAEFPGCVGPLAATDGYADTIRTYCRLEYNYLTAPPEYIFNPYAALIHQTLKSTAYAFSIDDKAAFLGVPGKGLIITIGGPNGLVYPTEQYPLQTAQTLAAFCQSWAQ